ncbi:MAG: hypothetical protein M3347_07005 [Armatimonadota bacterium]|nr:hypothetical protein [Armatimonadota bacterium]
MSKERLQRFISFNTAAFGVITAAAGLFAMEGSIIKSVLWLVTLLLIASAVYFFFESKKSAVAEIANRIPEASTITVRVVKDEAELRCLYKIEEAEYGSDNIIGLNGVLAWWECYPFGAYVLVKGPTVLGGVGIWPLTEETFYALVEGRLPERKIKDEDICKSSGGQLQAFWYIADLIIADVSFKGKKDGLGFRLLEGAIREWLRIGNLTPTIHICALAYSASGGTLLRKLGFNCCATSPDGHQVYMRVTTPEEIRQDLEEKIVKRSKMVRARATR